MQNAKGSVRVIGGLDLQGPKSPFLGSIERSSGGSVGTENSMGSVGAQMWSSSDDFELASNLTARSREIRGQMSRHMQEGTIDADAESLTNEGKVYIISSRRFEMRARRRKSHWKRIISPVILQMSKLSRKSR